MKEDMIRYLNGKHWSSGRDSDIIEGFIKEYFAQCKCSVCKKHCPESHMCADVEECRFKVSKAISDSQNEVWK